MRHTMVLAAIAMATAAGCGIPEEQHNEALNKVKQLQADMATQTEAWAETRNGLKSQVKGLREENEAMKSHLGSMGADLTKLKTQHGDAVKNLSQKEEQIAELMKAQEAARKRAETFRSLVTQFKQMIDSGQLKVNVRKGRMVVQLSDQILFDSGKEVLKPEGQKALSEVVRVLKEVPDRVFQVAGHTDNVPIRTARFKSNWELSTARAVNVVKFMMDQGLDAARLSAAGYADIDPAADNASDEGRKLNRRIEITLMPSIEELPKIDVQ